jgi:phage-related protein
MDTKPVEWVGSSRKDLRTFPEEVKNDIGLALWFAQLGDKHPSAKVLRGFGGAGVLEVVDDYDGDTYRAVYTVKFADAIYVLHCFQKKSKQGRETPQQDKDLIRERFKRAEHKSKQKEERK